MTSVSKLLRGEGAAGDGLRYDAAEETGVEQIRRRKQRHPVVVWSATKRCNLECTHCDAGFLVEYAREVFEPGRAERAREYLRRNGGDPAGERVADVDYQGNVHPTQFWQSYSLGNVRDRPFGAIWEDESNPVLRHLRERPASPDGACADCAYRDVCRRGSRLRALAVHGDLAARDPQCHLTPSERGQPTGASAD